MTAFKIPDSLIIGHTQIDGEHERLLVLLNQLTDDLKPDNDADYTETIAEMTTALQTHLENEENIMEGLGYPELTQHKQDHLTAKIKYDALIKDAGDGDYMHDLPNGLISIFVDDLINADMEFRDYLLKMNYKG